MKIAICDDDKKQLKRLEDLINYSKKQEKLEVYKYDSGEKLIAAYKKELVFSIIYLDMQMKDLNGIQTAEIIRKYDEKCIIIIVTSIIEYAIEGYSIDAFDFILKPVTERKFSDIFRKAVNKIEYGKKQTYVIQTRDVTKVLFVADILYIESNRKKVIIHYKKETFSNNENMSTTEKMLKGNGFVRISRYYLVNMLHIKEIRVKCICLSNGVLLNYSGKYRKQLKLEYMDFLVGGV